MKSHLYSQCPQPPVEWGNSHRYAKPTVANICLTFTSIPCAWKGQIKKKTNSPFTSVGVQLDRKSHNHVRYRRRAWLTPQTDLQNIETQNWQTDSFAQFVDWRWRQLTIRICIWYITGMNRNLMQVRSSDCAIRSRQGCRWVNFSGWPRHEAWTDASYSIPTGGEGFQKLLWAEIQGPQMNLDLCYLSDTQALDFCRWDRSAHPLRIPPSSHWFSPQRSLKWQLVNHNQGILGTEQSPVSSHLSCRSVQRTAVTSWFGPWYVT